MSNTRTLKDIQAIQIKKEVNKSKVLISNKIVLFKNANTIQNFTIGKLSH